MTSATARSRTVRGRSRSTRRTKVRRRRRALFLVVAALAGFVIWAFATGAGPLGEAVREITLPLRHDDIIRQQAEAKDVDAALIAAVIYEESKFRDQTSHAGARGLMQITPETADYIARLSGGTRFTQADLATPQINIAYGTYYLRHLLQRFDGNETLAVAAYNAGQTNVNRWVSEAGGAEGFDPAADIPFPETRHYVKGVLTQRESYRDHYADELGL